MNVAEVAEDQAKDVAEETQDENKTETKAKVKNTKKSNSSRSETSAKVMTEHQANIAAMKTGEPQDVGSIFVMPLLSIAEYDNPRVEPAALYEQGYILFGDPKVEEATEDKYVSLVHLALDQDIDHVRHYVELIEQYEGPICKLIHVDPETKKESVVFTGTEYFCKEKKASHKDSKHCKIEAHPSAPQSIVQLADDISTYGQLSPVQIQKQGNKFVMIEGGRRSAAILYLHAKSRVLREDGDEEAKVFPPTIKATDLKCGKDDLFIMSGMINISRKQFTPLQEGRFYHELTQRTNPETGKKYTMKEAADKVGINLGVFRLRHALWRPRTEAVVNERGEVIKPAKGLTDAERRKVALGEMTVTAASQRALGEKMHSETGERQKGRRGVLRLKDLQDEFDRTAENRKEYRMGLSFAMGYGMDEYEQACKDSEYRIEQKDRVELAETERKNKRRNKKDAA